MSRKYVPAGVDLSALLAFVWVNRLDPVAPNDAFDLVYGA